jgi:hypothetical protein
VIGVVFRSVASSIMGRNYSLDRVMPIRQGV